MSGRLNEQVLAALPPSVALPGYDRRQLDTGIVHLGLGAFHRAHQAIYTEDAIQQCGGNWGITGVSMRSDRVARQLLPQDCMYSVLADDGQQQSVRVVGVLKSVLVAATQLQQVCELIAAEQTRIVSLTITEKGYCIGADGRSLDRDNAQLQSDLDNPRQPSTALGILALALEHRRLQCGHPLTVISCDNLSANGRVLAAVLAEYVQQTFPELPGWMAENTRFPCSMVDRIVPASTDVQREKQAGLLGYADAAAIATEGFSQWVIEDDFCTDRPAWEKAGVQFVDDILPYENIKLGLVNATHSAIAYVGLLAGLETVDQVMADETLGIYVRRLMRSTLAPALDIPAGFDIDGYLAQLQLRLSNPCLRHRCAQIAMDGSEKIPQRWLAVLNQPQLRGELVPALAAWCWFVLDSGYEISDPRGEQLQRLRARADTSRLPDVLNLVRINSGTVVEFSQLCEQLEQNLNSIRRAGVSGLLAG